MVEISYYLQKLYQIPLNSIFDFQKLIKVGLKKLRSLNINEEGKITVKLTFIYPNVVYLRNWRQEEDYKDLIKKVNNTLNNIDNSWIDFDGIFSNISFPPILGGQYRDGDYFIRSIHFDIYPINEISLSEASLVLKYICDKKNLNFSQKVQFSIEISFRNKSEGVLIFSDYAEKKSINGLMKYENKHEILSYYEIMANNIAFSCKSFKIYTDEVLMAKAETRGRRNLYKDGKKIPIKIEKGSDLLDLVSKHNFVSFYHSIERIDGTLGMVVLDLDGRSGIRNVLGGDKYLWPIIFQTGKAIESLFQKLGVEKSIAAKFSGRRGIHLHYLVEKEAFPPFSAKKVDFEYYIAALKVVGDSEDRQISEKLIPSKAIKFIIQAFSLILIFEGTGEELNPDLLEKLHLNFKSQIFSLTNDPDDHIKLVIDTSSNHKSGVFRTCNSLHGSGYASINLKIGQDWNDSFSNWNEVLKKSDPDFIKVDFPENKLAYFQDPGVLDREDMKKLIKNISYAISILYKEGPKSSCQLNPQKYFYLKRKYQREIFQYMEIKKHGIEFLFKKMVKSFSPLCLKIMDIIKAQLEIQNFQDSFKNCNIFEEKEAFINLQNSLYIKSDSYKHKIYDLKSELMAIVGKGVALLFLRRSQKADLKFQLEEWILEKLQTKGKKALLVKDLKKLIAKYCANLDLSVTLGECIDND